MKITMTCLTGKGRIPEGYQVTDSGTWYDEKTPIKVIEALEEARVTKDRIRLFYGDHDTGVVWLEEHDVIGTVGRSSGYAKIPILIHSSRSLGGGAIMDNRILRIDTKRKGKIVRLYEAYNIRLPNLMLMDRSECDEGWSVSDAMGGTVIARFYDDTKTDPGTRIVHVIPYTGEKKARNYIAFMRGERWAI